MAKKIYMNVQGGVGDFHSGLARLPNMFAEFKEKHGDFYFELRGQTLLASYPIINWMLNNHPHLFKDLENYHISIQSFTKEKKAPGFSYVEKSSDVTVLEDWRDEKGKHFDMQFPFVTGGKLPNKPKRKILGVHVMTTKGDLDFAHVGGMNVKRYWPKDKWINLINELKEFHEVRVFGAKNEDWGIKQKDLGTIKLVDYTGEDLDKVIPAMLECHAFVGTNSWPWQVTAYAGIPTVCLYFTNPQWIPIHWNNKMKNAVIEEDKAVDVKTVIKHIQKATKYAKH